MATPLQIEIFHSLGDVNGDGVIDALDLAIIQAAFGSVPGSSNWNALADLNKDSKIDTLDVTICAQYQGLTLEQLFPSQDWLVLGAIGVGALVVGLLVGRSM